MKKKTKKFPKASDLDKMEKVLSKSIGTYILPPDAGAVEKAKYDVCKHILVYMHKKGLTQRQLARKMGIPETRVSEIVHYKISKFTLDKLVSYYEKINPKASLSVA